MVERVPLPDPQSSSAGVDLWCFFYEQAGDPDLLRDFEALLTPEERARRDRLYVERDRWMFLATRALVRTVLSAYVDVAPEDWRFAAGERGKPYVAHPPITVPLHFNLTNTRGLVACAVSRSFDEVGVDAESLDRPGETVAVADRYFAELETEALRALPPDRRRERFFRYWTLKEAYIKARGLGLAIPLDQFAFLLDEGTTIAITFDPRLGDAPQRWRFAQLAASPRHVVAVGASTGGAPLLLRACNYVPLRGSTPLDARPL